MRFFRTTWIPDETFFQTLVRHIIPANEIHTRTLTFLMFSDYGMPVTFYNDHYDLLLSQDFLFARKISPEAQELKTRLGALYADDKATFQISNEGRNLFRFLTERGRAGRRFANRFWETESTLGRDRELMIVICKKWHVAKRLVERIRNVTDLPAMDYLFNEEAANLPDLGGIEGSLEKRTRHRRSLMRMLFDYCKTDRLVVCIDPGNLELLQDFCADRSTTKLLEIQCDFSGEYLRGHAIRTGLAGEQTPPETLERLLPTIRGDISFESEQIRDAGFDNHFILRQSGNPDLYAGQMAQFLDISLEMAAEIGRMEHLFTD